MIASQWQIVIERIGRGEISLMEAVKGSTQDLGEQEILDACRAAGEPGLVEIVELLLAQFPSLSPREAITEARVVSGQAWLLLSQCDYVLARYEREPRREQDLQGPGLFLYTLPSGMVLLTDGRSPEVPLGPDDYALERWTLEAYWRESWRYRGDPVIAHDRDLIVLQHLQPNRMQNEERAILRIYEA